MAGTSEAGVLPVDKPVGPTSHDVVAAARRALRTKRVGHTGTLDPFASGLLLLCVGWATRLAEYLTAQSKTYRATVRLGSATETDDRTGAPVASSTSWRTLERADVLAALSGLTGPMQQRPPMYSAKKVGGVAMYRLARAGEAPEPAPAPITVYRLRLLAFHPPDLELEVVCSAGTYVRALARDLGEALNTRAHLAELRRIRVGSHRVEDALTLDELQDDARVRGAWLAPLVALGHLPRVDVDDAQAATLRDGGAPAVDDHLPQDVALAVAHGGRLLAIARSEGGRLRPNKVFHD